MPSQGSPLPRDTSTLWPASSSSCRKFSSIATAFHTPPERKTGTSPNCSRSTTASSIRWAAALSMIRILVSLPSERIHHRHQAGDLGLGDAAGVHLVHEIPDVDDLEAVHQLGFERRLWHHAVVGTEDHLYGFEPNPITTPLVAEEVSPSSRPRRVSGGVAPIGYGAAAAQNHDRRLSRSCRRPVAHVVGDDVNPFQVRHDSLRFLLYQGRYELVPLVVAGKAQAGCFGSRAPGTFEPAPEFLASAADYRPQVVGGAWLGRRGQRPLSPGLQGLSFFVQQGDCGLRLPAVYTQVAHASPPESTSAGQHFSMSALCCAGRVGFQRAAHVPLCCGKQLAGFVCGDFRLSHHYGYLDGTVGVVEQLCGFVFGNTGNFTDDASGAALQFLVGALEVYHDVLVHFSQPGESGGGEHVEDQFLRGAGFESGRAGQNLGSGVELDAHARRGDEFALPVVADAYGGAPCFGGFPDGGNDVRRAATRGESDHGVFRTEAEGFQVADGGRGVIFSALDGAGSGILSASEERQYALRWRSEGGGTLGRVERGDTSAGT